MIEEKSSNFEIAEEIVAHFAASGNLPKLTLSIVAAIADGQNEARTEANLQLHAVRGLLDKLQERLDQVKREAGSERATIVEEKK